MFFPVLALLLNRARSRITCWFTALALLGALSAALYAGHSGVIRVMLAFPAGMALGRAFHLQPVSRFHANILAFASCAVALVSLGVDILKPLSVFGFAGLIYSLATDQGPLTKLLSSPAAMFIGTISFSLYLTHQSLFMFLSWWQGDPHGISILLFIAAALLVATAAYRLVEAPSHRFARANVARLRTRDQTFERLRESEPLYSQP